jgi:ABC-type amino acid transport substrate-binding protein
MSGSSARWRLGAAFLVLVAPAPGPGRADEAGEALTGTLDHVATTGTLTLGYRQSSIPFSYLDKAGQPIGYSLDLCNAVAADVAAELEGRPVAIKYRPVTSETRIVAVRSGEVDLECGSTTSNFERSKAVAFSPIFFVAGTKLLVARNSGIASYRDLGGKTVVVTAGTTNEAALRAIAEKQGIALRLVTGRDHADSLAMLTAGTADAFATDDVLLYGFVAAAGLGDRYHVVGEYLSYDPYGLMFRKDDPAFAGLVGRTFARLAQSRELVQLYNKWFQLRLPTGEHLDLPMSPQLEEFFRVQGVPD